jgi:hypothetical protein
MSDIRDRPEGMKRSRRSPLPAVAAGVGLLLVVIGFYAASRPVLLVDRGNARWIRMPEPFHLRVCKFPPVPVCFRQRIPATASASAVPSTLRFKSYGAAGCRINGIPVPVHVDAQFGDQHHGRVVVPPSVFSHGGTIVFRVVNAHGPSALWAASDRFDLRTGAQWETRRETGNWGPAVTLDKALLPAWLGELPSTWEVIRGHSGRLFMLWGLILLLIFGWAAYWGNTDARQARAVTAVRCLAYVAWAAMGWNNLFKIPFVTGMDVTAHYDFVLHIWSMHQIPLPADGWQFFQTPLFYLLSAGLLDLLVKVVSLPEALLYLKLFPLFCGALQIELAFRLVKTAYPKKYWLQVIGIVCGGFLPMNLFASQFVGNEPLMGLIGGYCIVFMSQKIMKGKPLTRENALGLGLFLGLAILAKVSAVLLFVPILLFINTGGKFESRMNGIRVGAHLKPAAILATVVALVAGWYFVYLYLVSGSVIWSGWDGSAHRQWWQDPGFRTIGHYTRFGSVFVQPAFAGIHSVWDGLYATLFSDGMMSGMADPGARPPWNHSWMQIATWLSVLPVWLVALSGLRSLAKNTPRVLGFCTACLLTFLAAIVYMSLIVPTYSSAKSTYALSCIPAMALLMAAGADLIGSNAFIRKGIVSILIVWGVLSYGAVFVVGG